ncbi:DUF1217 domain-containing protein [Roseomonas sp. BN140053]|uniref:DUF1217 domain-containing protein n=1 Tax=Roseomonas sp. BN140053 TaxID=3391898 RepID=UPI0039E7CF89
MINGALALSMLGAGGGAGSRATSSPAEAVAALKRALAPGAEAKGVAQAARDPQVQRSLSRYQSALDGAKDLESALKDPRVLSVLLPALGLDGEQNKPALVFRALTSDLSNPKSLVNRLGDSRWASAAKTLNLAAGNGLQALRSAAMQQTITRGFESFTWRKGLDDQALGLSDALYAQENAATVDDPYDILGNGVMRRVVTGSLGLPDAMAVQSVETQARAITSRLDLSKLSDPREVTKLVQRYVMNRAQNNTGGQGSPGGLLSLLG